MLEVGELVILFAAILLATSPATVDRFPAAPPANGLLFQAGGVTTCWSGYVVDFDRRTITYWFTSESGREQVAGTTRTLTAADAEHLRALARRAIEENKTSMPPQADVNFHLDLSSNGRVTKTDTYGPMAANRAIKDLGDLLPTLTR